MSSHYILGTGQSPSLHIVQVIPDSALLAAQLRRGHNLFAMARSDDSGVIQDGGIAGGTGGTLDKTGTGTLTLTGANTYTGSTVVDAGSLFVNNTTGSGTGTASVVVVVTTNSSTTLGGSGTISGPVTVNFGANLAPGATGNGSTGILNTGTLSLPGSNFSLDLNGNVPGTNYDQVDVTGTVYIARSNLVLNSVSGLAVGDHLFILENDGTDLVIGTFAGLAEDATFTSGGYTFMIFAAKVEATTSN